MDIIHRLEELHKKVYKQKLTEEEFSFITSSLSSQCPSFLLIKRFDKEDSSKLYSTILASRVSRTLLAAFKTNQTYSENCSDVLIKLYEFLFKEQAFNSSICYLEYARLKAETNKTILEILTMAKTESVDEKMKYFLANKDDRDALGINFALIVKNCTKISNRDCKILNAKKMDVDFLEVLCDTKKYMTRENLKLIYNLSKEILLKGKRQSKETAILFAIISEVNTIIKEKSMDLLFLVPENINESYLGFLYSQMVDIESIERVWVILNEYNIIHEILNKLKVVREMLHDENVNLYHTDVFYIHFGVSVINTVIKNIKESKSFFITHSDSFLNLLWTKLPNNMLSALFEYCSLLIYDEEIQTKVYEYFQHLEIFNQTKKENVKTRNTNELFYYNPKTVYDVFEEELSNDTFTLTMNIITLCSKLLNYGMFEREIFEFFSVAIKSSDPEILLTILQKMVDKKYPITENMILNIKYGIEKNGNLCDSFLKFCISNSNQKYIKDVFIFILNNINLMYLIFSNKSHDFFKFIRQLDLREIVVFIGDDFLDRIADSPEEGLEYLIMNCRDNSDLCNFVIKRSNFFNGLNGMDALKLKLYEVLSEKIKDDFEFTLNAEIATNQVFILPAFYTNEYFNIISRKIECEYHDLENFKSYIIKDYKYKSENIQGYCNYLKTIITIGVNCDKEVKDIVNLNVESESIAELVGFYKAMKNADIQYKFIPKKLINVILNKIGSFDNDFFVKKFDHASSYEKFILFFLLNPKEMNEDIFKVIIKEINILVSNNPFSPENKPLLTHCLDFMVYSKSVSHVIKVFNGMEIPDHFVDSLIRINIVGLLNNEKEMFSIKLINRANVDLQVKICVLAFFNKTLSNEYIRNLVFSLRRSVVDENMEFIYKELQRKEVN